MKTKNTRLSKFCLFASVIGFTVFLTSCSKDDDIETGKSVNLKVVNAAEASGSQDFYVEGTKVATAVAEGESQGYIASANSGNDRHLEFKTSGSAEVYASKTVDLDDDDSYTIILSGTGNSATITAIEDDDMDAPASGKAKVRFVHLSSHANSNVDLSFGSSNTPVVSNVSYGHVSNFVTVDAGLSLLTVYNAGTTTNPVELNFAALAAGKIYTIILKGSSQVSTQVVAHN